MPSIQVMVRFSLRMVILVIFAAFAGTSFVGSMVALLWMAAVLCAVMAVMRRELPFRADLNHWDEMTSYLALCALASHFALPAPV
jgi:TRAP-type mannitol/chloroaromatic compound transport system permease small subunit